MRSGLRAVRAIDPRRRAAVLSCGALAALCLLGVAAGAARAACKTPLPDAALRTLDDSADVDPVRAVADARARLAAPGSSDPLKVAQLYAVIADAQDTMSNDDEARAAVAAGRASLAGVVPAAATQGLLLRLALVEADTAQNAVELEAALRSLNEWEARLPPRSLGHACLLLVRGRVQGRLVHQDLAARDGMEAYRLATELRVPDARTEAAYQLAVTYRRAALYDDGLRMIEEVIDTTRTRSQWGALANAMFVKAQLLDEMGEPGLALPVIEESRAVSSRLKDVTGLGFADHQRCNVLLALRRVDEAEQTCAAAERELLAVGRTDQGLAVLSQLARIDLLHGRNSAALARLDRALADDGKLVPPTFLARLYTVRAEALAALGRSADALRDLKKSIRVTQLADQQRRSLAVAVLSARQQLEQHEQERRELARQVQVERERAASRDLARRLAFGLAAAAALLCALFVYLLLVSRRYARELRRQETILRQTSEYAPDALLLLDPQRRIAFANRNLFGQGAPPSVGQTLTECVPQETRPAINAALARLFDQRESVSFDASFAPDDGELRHFELRGAPIVEAGQLIGATLRAVEVTDVRRLEREVIEVANRERQRLGAELHEGLGQELTGISLLLQTVAARVPGVAPDAVGTVNEAIAHLASSIAGARALARRFSPVQIERGSLPLALERLAADAAHRHGISVSSRAVPDRIDVPALSADHLYRIAEEALAGAVRRPGCRAVEIALRYEPDLLSLTVTDDAPGSADLASSVEGLGIRMMGYRARLLGGTLLIERVPEGGTRCSISVPLKHVAS